jgi:hypothetical protein
MGKTEAWIARLPEPFLRLPERRLPKLSQQLREFGGVTITLLLQYFTV